MKELSFYDVKAKKKFKSSSWKTVVKPGKGGKRKFAVATSPYSKIKCWRVLGMA